jgi:hypothetical protein
LQFSYAAPDHYYLSIASELTSTNLALVHSSCHSLRNMSRLQQGLAGEVNSFQRLTGTCRGGNSRLIERRSLLQAIYP